MKKLIRDKIIERLQLQEWDVVNNQEELNKYYNLKVLEERDEILNAAHSDIYEFADLIEVVYAWGTINGFSADEINAARAKKIEERGVFSNIILTNLIPGNPSNNIYKQEKKYDDY